MMRVNSDASFWTPQIVKPFLDPKTFKKVKFVYAKNAESQKIMTELFEEDTIKSTFEDPNDYTHEEYAKMMQDDDQKSSLHWKLAGVAKPEQDIQVSKDIEVPSVEAVKTEDTTSVTKGAPEEAPAAAEVTSAPEEAPEVTPPVATLVAAPAPVAAPVVAPVS